MLTFTLLAGLLGSVPGASSHLHLVESATPQVSSIRLTDTERRERMSLLAESIDAIDVHWSAGARVLTTVGAGLATSGLIAGAVAVGIASGSVGMVLLALMVPVCAVPGLLLLAAGLIWGHRDEQTATERRAVLEGQRRMYELQMAALPTPPLVTF